MKSQKQLKAKNGQLVILTTSWDDFSDSDLRLSQLLIEYNIPATFYIPSFELLKSEKLEFAKELLQHPMFDIGSHTITHALLTRIKSPEAYIEISGSKLRLESALGIPIDQFCYPRGYYSPHIKSMVKDAGYKVARTVHVRSTSIEQDMLELKTTIHVYDGRKEYHGRKWLELGIEYFERVMDNGGYFHLWGHSAEVNKYNQWDNLEWFLRYMKGKIGENI